jgi:HAD superfamily phosphatase (TIGR01668 family)
MNILPKYGEPNFPRMWNFLSLPLRPELTRTLAKLERFTDIDIPSLVQQNIRGLILDLDGTLVGHNESKLSAQVVDKIVEIQGNNIHVCILSNNANDRSDSLTIPRGVEVLKARPPKPHRECFINAMKGLGLDEPEQCAVVGDNFNTDAGARDASMHFIHVKPLDGREPLWVKLTRSYLERWALLHDFLRKITNKTYGNF